MYSVSCHCGKKISVRPSSAGTIIKCPGSQENVTVPSLSTLRKYDQLGQASPATSVTDGKDSSEGPDSRESPESLSLYHFCGEASSSGRVSVAALTNYSNLVVSWISTFLQDVEPLSRFELVVSCALLPEDKKLILVETAPANAVAEWSQRLKAAIEEIPAPPVVEGPVAFVVFSQVNQDRESQRHIKPFGPYQRDIEKISVDSALMRVVGLRYKAVGAGRAG